ncbi:outer membrane beta-barrel protein [Rariglobus hedericola]|nr:porin [Rariglobus hedericola]
MIKKLTGLASIVALASVAQAEVKINENLSLDGYAIGSYSSVEGAAAPGQTTNDTFLDSGSRLFDSVKVAVNGTYGDFSGKVSVLLQSVNNTSNESGGLLDAYLTYTAGSLAITGGKFNSWLGYESFDSPNNAFISYGLSGYVANYATGAKVEYITDTLSAGVSVRDSLTAGDGFYQGDGDFSDNLGYEAYVLYSGIDKLTLFAGAGFGDLDGGDLSTYNAWASYAFTEKFSLALEYAKTDDSTAAVFAGDVTNSWLLQGTYVVNDSVSVSGRVTAQDTKAGDGLGYGVASTYTITENFAVKGEVTKTDFNNGAGDVFTYAIQGLFKF